MARAQLGKSPSKFEQLHCCAVAVAADVLLLTRPVWAYMHSLNVEVWPKAFYAAVLQLDLTIHFCHLPLIPKLVVKKLPFLQNTA